MSSSEIPCDGAATQRRSLVDAICIFVVILLVSFSWTMAVSGNSADLLALYAASTAFAQGDLDLVYPAADGLFTILPPEEWRPMMAELGYEDELYPYLYPPLWAALGSGLVGLFPPEALAPIARPVNYALMLATFWLAWRITGAPMRFLPYLGLAAVATLPTLPGIVATVENQPQILVGVLVLVAIERSLANAPVAAGLALALAAAIKGFPALFVLLWVASANWRAVASFAGAGAVLAALSVALAGWQLHLSFLSVLRQISDTAVVLMVSQGFNPLVAQFLPFGPENVVMRPDLMSDAGDPARYVVIAKSPLWSAVGSLAPVIILTILGRFLRTASRAAAATILWPSALLWVAFFNPLPWSHSYIMSFAFLPALLAYAPRAGAVGFVAASLLFGPFAGRYDLGGLVFEPTATIGTLAVATVGLSFVWAGLANRRPSGAIAPDAQAAPARPA